MIFAATAVLVVFFLGMGVLALAAPERILGPFGLPSLTPEGRNEVRAVYGGFGVAMAAVLASAAGSPRIAPGVFLTVGAALAGMAAGRLVAALVERPRGFYPCWFYCAVEALGAAVLFAASEFIA
jgi:hypothetical protein